MDFSLTFGPSAIGGPVRNWVLPGHSDPSHVHECRADMRGSHVEYSLITIGDGSLSSRVIDEPV